VLPAKEHEAVAMATTVTTRAPNKSKSQLEKNWCTWHDGIRSEGRQFPLGGRGFVGSITLRRVGVRVAIF